MKCIFSVDVEDWFHILDLPSTPRMDQWNSLPSYVEKNFIRLLDIFSEFDVRVTCFFLAWVAQKYPALVREARSRGHEVASHGCSHRLVYEMSEGEFFQDVVRAKEVLEDAAGCEVLGYRASGFSITEKDHWFYDKLVEAGYKYDSSTFPAQRGHGGIRSGNYAPHVVRRGNGRIIEFPITVSKVLGKPLCFFGGGYLRLFPYAIIKRKAVEVLGEGRPVIFYIHPREIDPQHPRLPMGLKRRFKSYVNLKTTEGKLRRLFEDFDFTTFAGFVSDNAGSLEV